MENKYESYKDSEGYCHFYIDENNYAEDIERLLGDRLKADGDYTIIFGSGTLYMDGTFYEVRNIEYASKTKDLLIVLHTKSCAESRVADEGKGGFYDDEDCIWHGLCNIITVKEFGLSFDMYYFTDGII